MAVQTTSINDLMQMINAMSAGNREKDAKMENLMLQEFSSGADSMNNEDLDISHGRIKDYFSKNIGSMSDSEIEYFNMLDSKYQNQRTKNVKFEGDIARKSEFTDDMLGFADEIIRLQDPSSTNFTISSKKIINGKMTDFEEEIFLPNPNDYTDGVNDAEYIKIYNEQMEKYGGAEGYNAKKQEYIDSLNNNMQRKIGAFSDYMGGLITDYAGTGRLQNFHLSELSELEQTYQFIIKSMEDNGSIDKDEKKAYEDALLSKSSAPINDFIKVDNQMKANNINNLNQEMQNLVLQGEQYNSHDNIIDNIKVGGYTANDLGEVVISLPKDSPFNTKDDAKNFTVEDVVTAMTNPKIGDQDLINYINTVPSLIEKVNTELKVKDKSMLQNDGVSFLAGQDEDWVKALFDESSMVTGFVATQDRLDPPVPPVPVDVIDDKSLSSEFGIEQINLEEDIASVKTWAEPKIKKTAEELNSIKLEIDNYIVPKTPEINPNELNKILNRENETPVTYNDLKDLEKIYNEDVKEMERLYNEEQDMKELGIGGNDERRISVRKQINKLYHRWTNVMYRRGTKPTEGEEIKIGKIFTRPTPNSALSALRGGLGRVKSKEAQYNELKSKYDEVLKRTQK